jgi:penicillin-binding protein 1A
MRLIGYLFGLGAFLFVCAAIVAGVVLYHYSKDLPDYEVLAKYEPPVMTRVHASGGELMAEYARERRLYLPIQAVPDLVKAAFLSAEDKNFYSHTGVDPEGIARAIYANLKNRGGRLQGASTITQQVAKNFLLTSERSYDRKIKEALLSLRIEQAYSKDKILELYLNEIFFGIGAYGIAAASLDYFDKSVNELTLAEAAYLAALPKAPNNYHPFDDTEAAIERRNWVIDQMVENGYIRDEDATAAKATPLNVTLRKRGNYLFASDYFAEEVRRNLIDLYSEEVLYGGGLSVRTSLSPELQRVARTSLQHGLIAFDRQAGFREPVTRIDISTDWGEALAAVPGFSDVPEWRLAVVLGVGDKEATIGLQPDRTVSGDVDSRRETGTLPLEQMKWAKKGLRKVGDLLSPGDVVYVKAAEDASGVWKLQQPPSAQGALVAMDPYTGRVLALVGGFSFAESEFNRATQAYRQPGSSFKPFVYSAALDNGYTPSSVIMDAPIEIRAGGENWRPQNYGREFYGPSTLRLGIEKSRNVMTVRLAKDMGMPLIAEYARRFGIYDNMQPVLSMSLGAGETTALRMASAYGIIANGGRKIEPTLIDRIQDRYGRTIYKHDDRKCEGCEAKAWLNQDEPRLIDEHEQVLDPMTAYQITSMMEGVVTRGTAPIVRKVGKPIAGKTGTTNDYKDAWFVGFSPDLVVAVYVGYDQPKGMGRGATGGKLAAPIFTEFMTTALADQPAKEFQVPPGINLIAINRRTGLRASAEDEGPTIMEAFKPGTEPPSSYSIIGFQDHMGRPLTVSPDADRYVGARGTGGLY